MAGRGLAFLIAMAGLSAAASAAEIQSLAWEPGSETPVLQVRTSGEGAYTTQVLEDGQRLRIDRKVRNQPGWTHVEIAWDTVGLLLFDLAEALEQLAPHAGRAGVTLAIKPLHPAAAIGGSFLATLVDALEIVDELVESSPTNACVGLAIDLWHFGDDPDLGALLPLLVDRTALVQVADRSGPLTPEQERLPVGRGSLPLVEIAEAILECGYRGDFEFDPVGEAVEADGYDRVLGCLARTADAWSRKVPGEPAYRPRAGIGMRRSQASSQVVSPG